MSLSKKVFVIGEINTDLIMTGEDLAPQWNQEKLVDSFDMRLGSSSVITASVLAGLGLEVYFVGTVGADPFGRFCIKQMESKGINTAHIKVNPNIHTGVTLSLSTPKDRALLTFIGSISELIVNNIPENIFQEADHIHFGSYYLQAKMAPFWKTIFKQAQKNNISTSFDTGWDPKENWDTANITELLQYTNLFLPSEEEIKNIFRIEELSKIETSLPSKHGNIYIKLGSKGSMLVDENGKQIIKAGFSVQPKDTTGAGDSFNAGVIYGYLHDYIDEKILAFANSCGAIATLEVGGASTLPSVEDVKNFIHMR